MPPLMHNCALSFCPSTAPQAMRHVRRRLGSGAPIKVVNFDWHGNMGRLSEEKAVEGFWSLMEPFVKQVRAAAAVKHARCR